MLTQALPTHQVWASNEIHAANAYHENSPKISKTKFAQPPSNHRVWAMCDTNKLKETRAANSNNNLQKKKSQKKKKESWPKPHPPSFCEILARNYAKLLQDHLE